MGLRDRAIEWMDGVSRDRLNEVMFEMTEQNKRALNEQIAKNARAFEAMTRDIEERINEAYESGFYDGNDDPTSGDIAAGGFGYRRLSDKYVREGKVDYQKALNTAWELWQKSPVAKRVLALKRDHIIGHKAKPNSNDERLQAILDDFWDINDMEKHSSEFTMQLFGLGEQCYPAFVRYSDGRARIGYVDPASIYAVIKHPQNTMEDWAVVVDKYDGDAYTSEKMVYRIIREQEDFVVDGEVVPVEHEGKFVTDEQATLEPWESGMLAKYERVAYDGCCFYEKVNAVSNQSRGMSDLLQVGDWLDQADEVLFSLADREQFADFFAFDVTMPGANKEQVRERATELRMLPPKKGSVNVHTDGELWQMHSPDLRQQGSVETFRAILGLILGGMGFPVYWYGFGDDANRATATVQADPTAKSLEHEQGIIRDMFLKMCWFVADQAEIADNYERQNNTNITLALPEISAKDLTRVTASMQGLVVSLVNAEDARWITRQTAAEAFSRIMAELDIHYDVIKEIEAADKEQDEADRVQMDRMNGQLRQMLQNTPNPNQDMMNIAAKDNRQ